MTQMMRCAYPAWEMKAWTTGAKRGAQLALLGTVRSEEWSRVKLTTGPRIKTLLFPGDHRKEKSLAE